MDIPTYKWVLAIPIKQQGGTYIIVNQERWVDCTNGDPARQLAVSLNRDPLVVRFPYETCGQTAPGNPPAGQLWGIEATFHPRRVAGVLPPPVTFVIAWTDQTDTSAGHWLDECLRIYEVALPLLPENEGANFVHYQY